MWRRHSEPAHAPVPSAASELGVLTATALRWGLEAGFLGIEGHLEGRVLALVREASVRLFGNCEAERDRLLCEIEAMEKEYEDASRRIAECRENRERSRGGRSWIAVLRACLAELLALRAARALRRRRNPELRTVRREFETAERTRRDASEWREMAAQSLRATYEYHKIRAAIVRPEKEQTHDTRENRQFIVHGAY
jgi:hypothetical protein